MGAVTGGVDTQEPTSPVRIVEEPVIENVGGIVTQEPTPPIQTIEEILFEDVGGLATQEPTPPFQTIEELVIGNIGGVVTQEPTPPIQLIVEPLGETETEVDTTPQEMVLGVGQKENLEKLHAGREKGVIEQPMDIEEEEGGPASAGI